MAEDLGADSLEEMSAKQLVPGTWRDIDVTHVVRSIDILPYLPLVSQALR